MKRSLKLTRLDPVILLRHLFWCHLMERSPLPVRVYIQRADTLSKEYVETHQTELLSRLASSIDSENFMNKEEPAFWEWVHPRYPELNRYQYPLYPDHLSMRPHSESS
jgi:hypothetical protein